MTAPAPLVATTLATTLTCAGCGHRVPDDAFALRCPRARPGDDIDHVLRRALDPARLAFPGGAEHNPFVRYRTLWHGYHRARAAGRSDAEIVEVIERLDRAVAAVDGHGFGITPFKRNADLAILLEPSGRGGLMVKDETANVSGSHKARHLFGTMLALLLAGVDRARPLAIASCGNAALAAAVVARAAEWPLLVFVPEDADASVLARLTELGAAVTTCARRPDEAGDPPYLRLREAITDGAIPFTCQGNENGLAIEGGLTIGYEIADVLRTTEQRLDRLFVQVGGGALASSVIQGLSEARSLGVIEQLPRIHAVQTRNAHPLKRAYDLVVLHLLEHTDDPYGSPVETLRDAMASGAIDEELAWIARHRSQFMWPWTPAPHSVAGGILDDETYDWMAVVRGMLATGGTPVVVGEELLLDATELARTTTGVDLDPTSAAGLAGLLRLRQDGAIHPDETSAVLFTGIRRNGERP
ncbi:MAG TPA: pyridoxal-phosphate dependent enzyme [Patescibacteria group bacterium]|nr:pyridoxal-phosphate dependent enzyme [Patescibacteria group bacterium]